MRDLRRIIFILMCVIVFGAALALYGISKSYAVRNTDYVWMIFTGSGLGVAACLPMYYLRAKVKNDDPGARAVMNAFSEAGKRQPKITPANLDDQQSAHTPTDHHSPSQ